MPVELYFAFIAVSVAVIVIPGPSIMLIVAVALRSGRRPALYAVAGISAAMAIQLAIAVAGLTSVLELITGGLKWLRWLGVIVLAYLGIRFWRDAGGTAVDAQAAEPGGTAFGEGFMVALLNPTTMLFFVAFFPQFVTATVPVGPQLIRLSLTFWVLALGFDCVYALLAARVGALLQRPAWARIRNRAAGGILFGAAVLLAFARA